MLRQVLRSKIHMARIVKTELSYEGSIGIDAKLLTESGILPSERVQVLNLNNGERLETYVIEEEEGSGIVALYGPAAKRGEVGDRVCILSYALVDEKELKKTKPKTIVLDEKNLVISTKEGPSTSHLH